MDHEERKFHTFYGALLVSSFFIDPLLKGLVGPGWETPKLSIYPAAIAFIWLAVWSVRKLSREEKRRKALEERIKRLERRVNELEVKNQ